MLGLASVLLLSLAFQPELRESSQPTTAVAGQTEVARLVDLAAQRLHVRVEYDPVQLKGAVTVRGAGDGGIPDSQLWESVNSALSGRGFTTIINTKAKGDAGPSFTVVRLSDAAGLVLPEGPFTDNALVWPTPQPGYAAVFFKVSNRTTSLAEIQRLKPQQQTALLASKPTESVSASVRTALAAAGLGDATLRSVTPGSDEAVQAPTEGGPSYRRQNVTITLAPVTSRQLGQFLAAWRTAEPAWVIARIDLTHTGPDSESAYDARLMLSTTYLAPASTNTSK